MTEETTNGEEGCGAQGHFRALERLYAQAPINRLFSSRLEIGEPGMARIFFDVDERYYHAAGAVHGTAYFKMLDDAAFYAANSLVFVADSRLIDSEGEEIARGTGTFMRSHIPLASLPGYKKDD